MIYVLRTQRNAWIHGVMTVVVGVLGLWLRIAWAQWPPLLLAVALVWMAEFINSALEAIVDLASPGRHPLARVGKDVGAAAVLIAALAAAALGLIILLPPLTARLGLPGWPAWRRRTKGSSAWCSLPRDSQIGGRPRGLGTAFAPPPLLCDNPPVRARASRQIEPGARKGPLYRAATTPFDDENPAQALSALLTLTCELTTSARAALFELDEAEAGFSPRLATGAPVPAPGRASF